MAIEVDKSALREQVQHHLPATRADNMWGPDAEDILDMSVSKITQLGPKKFLQHCQKLADTANASLEKPGEYGGIPVPERQILHYKMSVLSAIYMAVEEHLEQSSRQQ